MKKQFLLMFIALVIIAGKVQAQIAGMYAGQLQYTLDSVCKRYHIKGASAAVYIQGEGMWSGVYGESEAGVPISKDMLFPIGSNTKTFTSSIILKMQENGQLSIEDTIGKWLTIPNVNGQITVRQMLNHTSGLYDYTKSPDFFSDFNADYTRIFQPEDMLKYIGVPLNAPGAKQQYCNTNYLLLGFIIKEITGQPVEEVFRDRIFNTQGFANTFFYPQEQPSAIIPHGWTDRGNGYQEDMQLVGYDNNAFFSMASSAGAIISTAEDNAMFWTNLMTGKIISNASLADMKKPFSSASYYGLGVFRYPSFNGRVVYAHGGTCFGYINDNIYDSVKGAAITVLTNQDSIENDLLRSTVVAALHKVVLKMPPTSVANVVDENRNVALYPNPATNRVTLHLENTAQAIFELNDMTGRTVMTGVVYSGDNSLVLNQPTGIYVVRVTANGQLLHLQKLQVNQ